jgi:hypothetical protein
MKKFLFLIISAFMLIISRPTPGWAVEDFEVVWEHDLSIADFNFFYENNYYTHSYIYALSSNVDNFLIYQDYYNSFKVLDLTNGNFIRRIVVDTNLSKFDPYIQQYPPDWIGYMQFIENKTKLAVYGSNGYFYIFDTKSWTLIRKVKASGYLSNDGKLLLVPQTAAAYIYDFNTMKLIDAITLENPAGYLENGPSILISNDCKRGAFYRRLDGWQQIPDAWLCEVYDLETKQRLFRDVEKSYHDVFINSDLSKIYLNNEGAVSEYDITSNKLTANWGIGGERPFRYKMSENEKYVFGSFYSHLLVDRINKNVQSYIWNAGLLKVGFLDADKDYILALRNITDSSASMIKVKINIEAITPVDEKSNNVEVLYPNPTNSNIHLLNIKIQNISEIKVSNEQGNDISKKCIISILPFGVDINMQKLITGVYFIQVNTATISKTYKTIKN